MEGTHKARDGLEEIIVTEVQIFQVLQLNQGRTDLPSQTSATKIKHDDMTSTVVAMNTLPLAAILARFSVSPRSKPATIVMNDLFEVEQGLSLLRSTLLDVTLGTNAKRACLTTKIRE